MVRIKINGRCRPAVGSGSRLENPQYRFAIEKNRFNGSRYPAFALDRCLGPLVGTQRLEYIDG